MSIPPEDSTPSMPQDPSPAAAVDPRPGLTHGGADWAGLRVTVVGLGLSGFAAADALLERGARVTIVSPDATGIIGERGTILEILGARILLGDPDGVGESALSAVTGAELVIVSPGVRPTDPLMLAAAAAGIPVWGEVELAWRMRPADGAAPWLTVTGTNGKTTTVKMLASILSAAGFRVVAAGNVGTPIVEAVLHPQPFDVIAVELSSFQLHWSHTIAAVASACLNVAPDHIDWHGSYAEYLAAKGKVYANTHLACIYNVDDPQTEQLVRDADVVEGCRAVGFTLGIPALSMLGVVDDILADRAFVEQRAHSAAELGSLADLPLDQRAAPEFVRGTVSEVGKALGLDLVEVKNWNCCGVPRAAAPHGGHPDPPSGHLHRRLQGDEPPRGGCGPGGIRVGRLGGGRTAQGGRRGLPGRQICRTAPRRRPPRGRPARHRDLAGPTSPRPTLG